jgi:hypothetical protein
MIACKASPTGFDNPRHCIWDEKNKKGRSRQADHVNLAKSLAGSSSERGRYYIDTYLRTGDSISKNIKDPKERDEALFDHTRYFLFDKSHVNITHSVDFNVMPFFFQEFDNLFV